MAGTIVADTIQDGAGNSTSMDNAIYGSAKAWVNFTGSTAAIKASYNVSSITRASAGQYTINFTNALSDANYCGVIGFIPNSPISGNPYPQQMFIVSYSASSILIATGYTTGSVYGYLDFPTINVTCFR